MDRIIAFVVVMIFAMIFFVVDALADGNMTYGKKIYEGKCASCHGMSGDGNSPMSKHVKPTPSNFVSKGYKDSHGKNTKEYTDAELKDIIMLGRKGTSMVGFGESLTDGDIEEVLSYIRSFHGDNRISYID